ncbi:MAG: hypothetical protein AAFP22_08645, partial [Planctomycetota bacterium]
LDSEVLPALVRTSGARASPPAIAGATVGGRVAPTLLAVLGRSASDGERAAAFMALARCAELATDAQRAALRGHLSAALDEGSPRLVRAAAVALGVLGDPRDAGPLLGLLAGRAPFDPLHGTVPGPEARTAAARGLALLAEGCSDPGVVTSIAEGAMRALDETDQDVSLGAAAASLLGHCALPLFPRGAEGVDPRVRSRSAAIGWLTAFTQDRDRPTVRAHALCALGALASDANEEAQAVALGALVEAASAHQDAPRARAAAVLGLAHLRCGTAGRNGVRADRALRRSLQDGGTLVRRTAAIALARSSTQPGTSPAEESVAVRRLLERGVLGGRASDRPWFALALGDQLRRSEALGATDRKDAQRKLVRALKRARGPGDTGAFALAAALGSSPNRAPREHGRTVREIERALERIDGADARAPLGAALAILGSGRTADTEEALERTLDGARHRSVARWHALRALRLDADAPALERARTLLASKSRPEQRWGARIAAQLHGRGLDGRLLALAGDEPTPYDVRIAAIEALGERAARTPWAAPLARTTPFFSAEAGLWEQDVRPTVR